MKIKSIVIKQNEVVRAYHREVVRKTTVLMRKEGKSEKEIGLAVQAYWKSVNV